MTKLAAGAGWFSLGVLVLACSGSRAGNAQPDAGAADQSDAAAGSGGTPSCTTNKDCSVGICSAGTCKKVSCVPGTTFCSDGGVWSCAADGTPAQLSVHCTADQFCLEKSGAATCSATACFAGDRVCAGSVATVCKPDGSGPKPGGDDCAQAKQVCYAGQCQDQLCTPGQKICDGNTVYLCSDAGTSRTAVNTCSALEVCDAAMGACEPKLCDPGKLGCDSNRIVMCNAVGSGYVQSGTDCAANSAVCVSGTCQPKVCTPGQGFCKDGNAYYCSGDGTAATLSNTCSSNSVCAISGTSAYCNFYTCQPNQPSCNGNVLATCNSDGTDWVSGGTDCTLTNASCIEGKCSPNKCSPDAAFCQNGNVELCDPQGLTFSQLQFCAIGSYCALRGGVATCAPTPCTPDTDGCAGEKLGHCATDGLSVGAGATDCGAAKQVCTLLGCSKTAVDPISTAIQLGTGGANEVLADVIDVDSPRKLTTIEASLSMPSARTLVWVVYVQTNVDGSGEFDLKYQKSTSGSGAGYQSSGPISVELEAGKTYAIGVTASDGSFVYSFDSPPISPSLNFAHVTGSIDTSLGSSFDYFPSPGAELYVMRLTTTTP